MPRRLPTLTLTLGCTLALFGLARVVFADEPKGQPVTVEVAAGEPARVRVDPADGGPTVEGVLEGMPAVPLRTDIGTRLIDLPHVRRVTFQRDPQGHSQDVVQLANKEIVRGRVTADEFRVRPAGGEPRTFKKAEVREIRVVRDEDLSLAAILIGLVTLAVMEIVLGVDNVIFLAIEAGKLPPERQARARQIGLAAALGTRILLLLTLSFLLGLTAPVFTLPDLPLLHDLEAREVSWRDIILLAGGVFLIGKSVWEMHEKVEHAKAHAAGEARPPGHASFARVIATIAVIDIVFSLDSVITAVGMVEHVWVMVVAMVIAMLVMLAFSGPIARFVDNHPTVKVLALAFLILIGVLLVAEALGQHMNKGYIYFAMAFAVAVELVNMQLRGTSKKKAEATAELPGGVGSPEGASGNSPGR
ncbi:MAG: TerC family protein [Gemmataceae bacterium]|nr:TerC family protein [Gemmataceae bacterium]